MQEDKFRDLDNTTWIGKHVPSSIPISADWIAQPIFWYNSNPEVLFESFVGALDGLATQSKAQMKLKIWEIETSVKSKLNHFFSAVSQRSCRKEPVLEFEDACIKKEEQDKLTQFLQPQKNHFFDLQDHLEHIATFFKSFASEAQNTTLIQQTVNLCLSSLINERLSQ